MPKAGPAAAAARAELRLEVVSVTDAHLEAVWARWVSASDGNDIRGEQAARAELLRLREKMGLANADLWAVGLLRRAARAEAAGDSGAAVEMARSAVELAPDLPAAWVGLARVYLSSAPGEPGRYLSALQRALERHWVDPKYFRLLLADWGCTFLVALTGIPVLVLLVLALRRGRYFLYDFRLLFPRTAWRGLPASAAVLLLSLPVVFRLGLAPSLLALFLALTMYLSRREQAVAAVLIGVLGLVPVLGRGLARATAFAGTDAERADAVDRAGPGVEPLAAELALRASEGKARFQELMALGRYQVIRGSLPAAAEHLRAALAQRPDDARAQTNLATALFLQGDLENPRALYESAAKADPKLAIAVLDLGRLHQRRVLVLGDSAAGEVDLATTAFNEAHRRDPNLPVPSLLGRADAAVAPEVLGGQGESSRPLTVPLDPSDLVGLADVDSAGRQISSQLSGMLTGSAGEAAGLWAPLVLGVLVALVGRLAGPLGAATPCEKCGQPVSARGDPEVRPRGGACTPCVNAFASKNAAAPALKVRKQLEVARHQAVLERTSYALGLAFSGMGHVFSGAPVRGGVLGFFFLWALAGFVLRHGVLRAQWEPLPLTVRMAPFALLFTVVYLLALRGLRRKEG